MYSETYSVFHNLYNTHKQVHSSKKIEVAIHKNSNKKKPIIFTCESNNKNPINL